ncbi:putative efflux pump outer membrane protein TtgC precursor [compost metagenome]
MRKNSNMARHVVKSGHHISAIAIAVMTLSACSLAPKYERPLAPVSQNWHETALESSDPTASSSAATLDWQAFVIDDNLRKMVTLALENNRDLVQAVLNIQVARAQYGVQRADRLPGLALDANGARQRVPADLNASGNSGVQSTYQVGLGLSAFEIDLFGRVRNLSQAALQEYLSVEANASAVRISLISDVIQQYLIRDSAQRRKILTEQTLKSRVVSLDLVSKRLDAGATTALDYQEAFGLAEQAKADYERVDRELRQATNALQLLVGVPEVLVSLPERPIGTPLLQRLAAGAPSDLLSNRPDILAAEYQLLARNASIGAARAAFFPRISLTAMLGSSSAELGNLFEGGQRSWSFAPQLSLPIFQGGRNTANLDLAVARKDIAVAHYEKTVQTAFREVSDALAATDTLRREELSRLALAQSSISAQKLAELRYRSGVDSHLRYLEAQRSAFANQVTFIDVSTQHQLALANLFRALGGGWQVAK